MKNREKIAPMDDDTAMLHGAEGMFGRLGYETLSVRDAAEAIKICMAAKEGPAPESLAYRSVGAIDKGIGIYTL